MLTNPELVDRLDIALDALMRIKSDEGIVCEKFELCTHAACRSSYTAWAIADEAIKRICEKTSFLLQAQVKREQKVRHE